ncbi:MAG: hypothetical protein ISS69_10970 [Phycisphaerae bacterium]|nr:hypothetical protein [Phycisphaerae bacterium]
MKFVNFPSLPRHIKAKAGDIISLQLMYCPGGSEKLPRTRREIQDREFLKGLRQAVSSRGTNMTLLSNRLKFKLTNKMIFDMKRNQKK